MPGGKGNINGAADGKPFTKDYQPKNRRKSTKFLTEALIKGLKKKKDIFIEGFHPETGVAIKIRVPMPTKEIIIAALLRKAANGDMIAIKEVLDRTEGKSIAHVQLSNEGDAPFKTETKHTVNFKKYAE